MCKLMPLQKRETASCTDILCCTDTTDPLEWLSCASNYNNSNQHSAHADTITVPCLCCTGNAVLCCTRHEVIS